MTSSSGSRNACTPTSAHSGTVRAMRLPSGDSPSPTPSPSTATKNSSGGGGRRSNRRNIPARASTALSPNHSATPATASSACAIGRPPFRPADQATAATNRPATSTASAGIPNSTTGSAAIPIPARIPHSPPAVTRRRHLTAPAMATP